MNEIRDFVKSASKVNLLIVVANILVFIVLEIMGSTQDVMFMAAYGAAYTPDILDGSYYQLVTSMFLHFGIEHLVGNMLVLLFLGDVLERMVGKIKYILIYFIGGIGANLFSCYWEIRTDNYAVSAGASGAVFAVIGALLWVVIVNRGRVENISGQRLFLMAALSLYQGYTSVGVDNQAHLGGLLLGFGLSILLYRKRNVKTGATI